MQVRFVVCGQYAKTWLFGQALTGALLQEAAKNWLSQIAPDASPRDAAIYVCYGGYGPANPYREQRGATRTLSLFEQRHANLALYPECLIIDGSAGPAADVSAPDLTEGQGIEAAIAAHIRATPAGDIVVLVSSDCGDDGYTEVRDAMNEAKANGAQVHNVQFWTGGQVHRAVAWKTYGELCGPDQFWLADVTGGKSARRLSQYQDLQPEVWERVGLWPSIPSPPLAPEVDHMWGTLAVAA